MADWKSALAAVGATEDNNNEAMTDVECKKAQPKVKKRIGVVYSTNPDFEYEDDSQEQTDTLPKRSAGTDACLSKNQQKLRLSMERAGRGGKTVTLVKGFIGTDDDINSLCKLLKQKCGVGGAVKYFDDAQHRYGEIIIQGDHRQRLIEILKKDGYTQTK